jgi:flagellar basal-body rod protein FlgB
MSQQGLHIFDENIQLLEKVMDLRSQRQMHIASNIANSQTPGYSPIRMRFLDNLNDALGASGTSIQTTHQNHMPSASQDALDAVEPEFVEVPDTSGIGDKNGVSVDQEMIYMADNRIRYEAAVQMVKNKMGLLKYVVQEGR